MTRTQVYAIAQTLGCDPVDIPPTVEALAQDCRDMCDRVLDVLDRYGIGEPRDLLDAVLKLCDDYERVQREALALERRIEATGAMSSATK